MGLLRVRASSEPSDSKPKGESWNIDSPISIPVSTHKKFSLNLNVYRNAHHRTLHAAKLNYEKHMQGIVGKLPKLKSIELHYKLFKGSHHELDVSNICSVVDKFFSDVLVKTKTIPDDNHKVISKVTYEYGGYDKENPRVEVTIISKETIP